MSTLTLLILLTYGLASGEASTTLANSTTEPDSPICQESQASEILPFFEAIEKHLFIFSIDEATLSKELKSAADQKYFEFIQGLYQLKTSTRRCPEQLQEFLERYVSFHLPNPDSEIRELGLSNAEVFAIRTYTGEDFSVINQILRSQGDITSELEPFLRILDRALSKVPKYEGWVARGTSLPKEVAELHQVGEVVSYPAYTSASAGFVYPGKYQFRILSLNGRNIDVLSQNKGEGEVLFKRNSQFKVLSREPVGDEVHIEMMELNEPR